MDQPNDVEVAAGVRPEGSFFAQFFLLLLAAAFLAVMNIFFRETWLFFLEALGIKVKR